MVTLAAPSQNCGPYNECTRRAAGAESTLKKVHVRANVLPSGADWLAVMRSKPGDGITHQPVIHAKPMRIAQDAQVIRDPQTIQVKKDPCMGHSQLCTVYRGNRYLTLARSVLRVALTSSLDLPIKCGTCISSASFTLGHESAIVTSGWRSEKNSGV